MNSPALVPNPDLRSVLLGAMGEALAKTNCHLIGTVTAVQIPPGTVSVQINAKRNYGGQLLDYPLLTDVPVLFPRGGNAIILLPIAAGDDVLLCFNDRDMDTWWATGATSAPPNSPRLHSLSDAIAIPGINSKASPVTNWSASALQLLNGASGIKIETKLGIFNAAGSLSSLFTLLITALTALNAKTGPDASAAITAVSSAATALLE